MLATCWAQGGSGTLTLPVRVMNQDTQALLDTGSVVTLHRPELVGGKKGEPLEVPCVHGDTRTYRMCHVVIRTPQGVFTVRAGMVPHLPVPLLIRRDCRIFHRLWNPERETRARREPFHQGGRSGRPAYGATRVPRTPEESTAEDQGSEGDRPSPPGYPLQGGPPGQDRRGPPQAPRTHSGPQRAEPGADRRDAAAEGAAQQAHRRGVADGRAHQRAAPAPPQERHGGTSGRNRPSEQVQRAHLPPAGDPRPRGDDVSTWGGRLK